MALTKQSVAINFAKGLDTKTDPFQVQVGQFLNLQNSIFDRAGLLQKRNGFGLLASLPDKSTTFLTTFNNNLTAIGSNLQAYSSGSRTWVNKGKLMPVALDTLPLVRSSTNQAYGDAVVASNGLVCVAYQDQTLSSINTPVFKYAVLDSATGQYIQNPTNIPNADPTYGTPKVYLLSSYFVIVYTSHPGSYQLNYIAISTQTPSLVNAPKVITSSYAPTTSTSFECVSANNTLFIAYNTTSGGQAINLTSITPVFNPVAFPEVINLGKATVMCITADVSIPSAPIVYLTYYDSVSQNGYVATFDKNLNPILSPTLFVSGQAIVNITSTAYSGQCDVYVENPTTYGYDTAIPTHTIQTCTISSVGGVSSFSVVARSVGLASKAFRYSNTNYFLTVYNSSSQPTYFLMNGSGKVISKLAYSNAGPYNTTGLPNFTLTDNVVQIPYLYKDLITSVNKSQNVVNSAGIYSQTGVNLATYTLEVSDISASEIGNNLNITGGFLAMYDGVAPVEQGFFLYPDYIKTTATTGGSMPNQTYFYQVTYEWSDNQGNVHRSAPSIPVQITLSGGQNAVTINIPTLRLTYKLASPPRIVIYRWSTNQQSFYEVTSIASPTLNDPSVDYISYTDTASDASILGNTLIYTTGGVLEDIAAPASLHSCLFNNRLFLVDAEDQNLLWYSKQVIEATPVEMSDLLTLYIAPTTASQGSTGPMTALGPMDDKLIIFKRNALGYINGTGPDNTGANSQYSDFTLINSTVGCTNQKSIVFMPEGLMFQSSKGIWLVSRNLSTTYIGAPVQAYTQNATVKSAVNIPNTTQVRFTLDSGITLMYDYYYGQWSTFTNVPAVSSTVYQNLHTYVNASGQVLQETPGSYLDGSAPVLMSFTTAWINTAGLQDFQRAYYMYLLGTAISPYKLSIGIAYDYNTSVVQSSIIVPEHGNSTWGSDNLWGGSSPWGGVTNVEQNRVFFQQGKCQSIQVTLTEQYDVASGIPAGAGLTLSGLNMIIGTKGNYPRLKASRSVG